MHVGGGDLGGAELACVGVRGVVAVGRVTERLRPERVGSPSREERGALDRCEHHRGGARVLGGGQAEEAVDAERPGDPVAEQRADRASVGAARDLAHEVTERDAVIAVRRTRLPPGFLRGEGAHHRVPVRQRPHRHRPRDGREAGLVGEQVAHGKLVLPRGRELRPVARHRRVEIDRAALDELEEHDRGQALRAREHARDRVARPRTRAVEVEPSSPQVGDATAVDLDAQ